MVLRCAAIDCRIQRGKKPGLMFHWFSANEERNSASPCGVARHVHTYAHCFVFPPMKCHCKTSLVTQLKTVINKGTINHVPWSSLGLLAASMLIKYLNQNISASGTTLLVFYPERLFFFCCFNFSWLLGYPSSVMASHFSPSFSFVG